MTESAEAWDTLDNDLNAVAAMLPYTPQITKRLREESKAYGDARAREALDTPEGVLTAMEGIAKVLALQMIRAGKVATWVHGGQKYYRIDGQGGTRDEVLALIGKWMGGNE